MTIPPILLERAFMRFSCQSWEYSRKDGSARASPLINAAADLFKLTTWSNIPAMHRMWGNTQMSYIMSSRCICDLGKETMHRHKELSHPLDVMLARKRKKSLLYFVLFSWWQSANITTKRVLLIWYLALDEDFDLYVLLNNIKMLLYLFSHLGRIIWVIILRKVTLCS